jgi:hypothetical protein
MSPVLALSRALVFPLALQGEAAQLHELVGSPPSRGSLILGVLASVHHASDGSYQR